MILKGQRIPSDSIDSARSKCSVGGADDVFMHVLPKGFMKIRHYGILGNRNKTERLNHCKLLTGTQICEKELLSAIELLKRLTGHDIGICPACG